MLYIVTKVFADSDLNSGLQDIEVFTSMEKVKEYVRDLHDDIIEPLEGVGGIEDDFEDGNISFEINHPEFRISVDTSEREII